MSDAPRPCLESQGCQLIPLSYLLSCFSDQSSCAFCLVIFLLMVCSPDFFSRELSNVFHLELGFYFILWLLLSSQEIKVGRWYVQHAAVWHWFVPLCICIFVFSSFVQPLKNNLKKIFNLVLINQTDWLMIPACPSLMCIFTRGNTEGINSLKNAFAVQVSMFYVGVRIGFVD